MCREVPCIDMFVNRYILRKSQRDCVIQKGKTVLMLPPSRGDPYILVMVMCHSSRVRASK